MKSSKELPKSQPASKVHKLNELAGLLTLRVNLLQVIDQGSFFFLLLSLYLIDFSIMDAPDLLSFLRGELPVPKPSTPASSSPQSDLQKLFKGFPPLATSTPPASSSNVPPTIQSPVNPLLSLLNFGNSPPITSPSPALPVKANGISGTAELLARLGLGSSTSPQIDRNVEVKESTPLAAETEADEPIEEISEVHGIKMEEDLIISLTKKP